jgi:DNA processing protein
LPSGVNQIYPASHAYLARQILESDGLIISEQPHTYRPQRYDFVKRNRIIAGLSDILVIPEAGIASGSLNTARHALDLGITIMAVPGDITSPYSAGTNRLIQSGAVPLLDPQDILDYLGISGEDKQAYIPENIIEQSLMEHIKRGVSGTNDLIKACKVEPSRLQANLTMLEIKGVITVQGGNWRIL